MLRFLTAGESHGKALTAILDGIPAGLPITASIIDLELARRQKGYGSGGRMKIEKDTVQILGGILAGETIGSPIALLVENDDHIKWKGKAIEPMTAPRPTVSGPSIRAGVSPMQIGNCRTEPTSNVPIRAVNERSSR